MTILITLSVWFVVTLLIMLWLQRKKLADWKRTDGVVAGLSGRNEAGCSAVVEFVTDSGKSCTLYDRTSTYPSRYTVGQNVSIAYDPQKPTNAIVLSFGGVYSLRCVAIAFGVTIPLLAIALLLQQ
jgi:hypothetical protein